MTTPAHTPTLAMPMHHSCRQWDDSDTICDERGQCIAIRPRLMTAEQWKDYAALIVRAVNSFDALVAAIKNGRDALYDMLSDFNFDREREGTYRDDAIIEMDAALALADAQ